MAKRLAPCCLELGGNDPFIVLADADVEAAAAEAAVLRTIGAGQVCISPKRFIVHRSVKEAFTRKALEIMSGVEMGYKEDIGEDIKRFARKNLFEMPREAEYMPCLISESAAKTVEAQVRKTVEQGAKILLGGTREGAYFAPTILADVTKDMDIAKDMEVFGPVMPIIGFETVDEAIEIANNSCFGLSGCVMTRDWKAGMRVAREVESGTMVINGVGQYRNMMQPFGGFKLSGNGKEGFITLGEMTREKNVVLKNFLASR
jgi:succinate-semialdehyde dehydrogenase/glutarate-semialdehyde dehydrogenase